MDMRKELLEILACPRCRGQLEILSSPKDAGGFCPTRAVGDTGGADLPCILEGLCCRACAMVYPVREGIPVMLIEEALPLHAWPPGSTMLAKPDLSE